MDIENTSTTSSLVTVCSQALKVRDCYLGISDVGFEP